jgi:site-specific DNA-methyltransferase (adenine-specific)
MSITFLHGDCLEKMKDLSGASVDCFICDLPYGCLASTRTKQPNIFRADNGKPLPKMNNRITGCSWDIALNLEAFWTQIRRLRKNDHTPCIMFCTTKFGYDLIKSNEKEFRYDLVWDKQRGVSFLSANKMPMRSHEMIYIFAKSGAFYNRVDVIGQGKAIQYGINKKSRAGEIDGDGRRCVLSVIQNPTSATRSGHPTEKPIELYNFLIQRYCPPGGTILDPTAGSFNSCFAAMELDRHAIGIEKDETFFNKACKKADDL